MARRRRRAPRRSRRARHGRGFKRILLALVILVPLAYFTFTVMLFDPFEDSQPAFPTMVPRDVDVYARRLRLDTDFTVFPAPRLVGKLERSTAFKDLAATAWWQALEWPRSLAALQAEVAVQTADLPLDIMEDLLGSEAVVVGRRAEDAEGGMAWALMTRISSSAKLSVEMLDFDFALQKAVPGAAMEEVRDEEEPSVKWRKLTIPGEAPLYLRRMDDLLVVGRDERLVRDILREVSGDPERSLGLSRLYRDRMPDTESAPDDHLSLELMADLGAWREALLAADSGPDDGIPDTGQHPDAVVNLLKALFDMDVLEEAVGRLEIHSGEVSLRAHAELTPSVTVDPAALRGTYSFDVTERMRQMFTLMPSDVAAVASANVELRPFLRTLTRSFDADLMTLVDDTIRDLARYTSSWKVESLEGLVAYLDRALGGEITLALRPIDHEVPEGTQPLPLMAFMVPLENEALWDDFVSAVIRGRDAVGLSSDQMFQVDEGVGVRKWIGLPAGGAIEEISFISMDWEKGRKLLIVATDDDFVREMVEIYTGGRRPLGDKPQLVRWFGRPAAGGREARPGDFAGSRANIVTWADGEALRGIVEGYAQYVADEETWIDYGPRRATERRRIIGQDYPQHDPNEELPADKKQLVEAQLDDIIRALDRRRRTMDIPAFAETWRERWSWLALLEGGTLALRWGTRDADLHARIETVVR